MPKYKVTLSDGTTKTIYWDKPTEPTDQDLIDAPEYVESKPSALSRFTKGLTDVGTTMYQGVRTAGKKGMEDIKAGNYPAAFHDIAEPILAPFEGIQNFAMGQKPDKPGTQLAEQAGIPLTMMQKSYNEGDYARLTGQGVSSLALLALSARGVIPESRAKLRSSGNVEHGPYPLRDYPSSVGPEPKTTFEGLTPSPETPKVNWDDYQQQGLNLEFDPQETQPTLSGLDKTPQQQAFDALIPNRYKPTEPQLTQPEIPGPLEPKILGNDRPTWASFAEQRNLPFDSDSLARAETSGIPELTRAAQQVVESSFRPDTGWVNPNKISNLRKIGNDWFQSDYETLVKDSVAGKGIAD